MLDRHFSEEAMVYNCTNDLNALLTVTYVSTHLMVFVNLTNKKIGRTPFISWGSQLI